MILHVTARAVRCFGYHVLTTSSGPAALELAREHPGPIDSLLSDVVMPGMHGHELAQRLQRQRARREP